jgi:hypothetical protein
MTFARKKARLLIGFALFYWLAFGGTFAGALSWRHQLLAHAVVFVAIVAAGWTLVRRQSALRLRGLPVALNVTVGLILVDKLWRALIGQSWNSREDLALSLSLCILFYLLLNILDDGRALAAGCVLAAAACCLIGLALAYMQHEALSLPLGNRVLMAGLFVLVTPLAVALAADAEQQKWRRILWAAGAAILFIGVIRTRSSAAIAILPILALLYAAAGRKSTRKIAVSAVFVVAVAGGAYWLADYNESLGRLKSIVRYGTDLNLENRERYWSGSLPAIRQKMLAGWGAGAVGVNYPPFRIQSPGFSVPGEAVTDLHDVPMQWLFEFGVAGAALRLAAFIGFLAAAFSAPTILQRASVLALAGYGVFSLAHYQLQNPAICLVILLTAVMAAPRGERREWSAQASSAFGLLLLVCAVAIFSHQSRLDYANYLLAKSSSEPDRKAVDSTLRASLLDFRCGFYDAVAAVRIDRLLMNAGQHSADTAFLLEAAERHYRRALEPDPWAPQITAAQGSLLQRAGKICDSIEPLEKAASLDFYFSLAHFNLANAYAACAAMEQATAEAAITLMTNPGTAFATQWRANPAFLTAALDQSLRWLDSWNWKSIPGNGEKLRRLDAFLRAVRESPLKGKRLVEFTMVDGVAGQLVSDPFAYVFQRRTPAFESTRIEVDGLDTGTWAPEGMGRVPGVRPLTYAEIHSAYRDRKLDELMRSLRPVTLVADAFK